MSAWERESGELPVPNLPPSGRKAGRGLFVFLRALIPSEIFPTEASDTLDRVPLDNSTMAVTGRFKMLFLNTMPCIPIEA